MSDLDLKGSWNQLKGKLKQEFSHLTENDLTYAEGKEDELVGRLQEKLGKTKDEVKNLFNRLVAPVAHEARVSEERAETKDTLLDKDADNGNMRRG